MKLAIAFLIFGAALAVPQNFYLTFHPKANSPPPADSTNQNAFRGPLNQDYQRNSYGLLPRNPFGLPFFQNPAFQMSGHQYLQGVEKAPAIYSSSEDDDHIEGRNRVESRLFFGGGGGGGGGFGNFFYPFFPSVSTKILTLLAYTSTVNATLTMAVVSTCIPVASFSASAATGTACTAAGRRRRSLWENVEEREIIDPSTLEEVIPTAVEDLPSANRPTRDLQIMSSQDEHQVHEEPHSTRRKRLFFGLTPTITLTSILTTISTSTTFTQITNTSTLSQYSSFTCLPPGFVVCK